MSVGLTPKLNEWINEETPVIARTIAEDKFTGTVNWFDNYNISLETENGEVVLFKGTLAYLKPIE